MPGETNPSANARSVRNLEYHTLSAPRTSLLTMNHLLALVALAAPHYAQTVRPLRPAPAPREIVRIDAATGVVTRGAARSALGEVSEFPNLDMGGFVTTDTGGGAVTWVNDGIKGAVSNRSDLLSRIVIPYCSAELDPSLGGPGATLKLGLYEGYTRNQPTPSGTRIASLALTGLPAHTSESSFFGNFSCYFLEIELDPLLSFADGPIGYSWEFADLGADGLYSGTFPFLASTSSCSATVPDPQGQAPYECCSFRPADAYDANGQLIHVVTFAPYCIPYSIAIDLREVADVAASAAPFVGDGVNVDIMTASAPLVGAAWTAQVALGHAHGTSGSVRFEVRANATNGPTQSSPLGGRPYERLISGPRLASFLLAHDGVTSGVLSTPLPASASLVGATFATQAIVIGGGFADLSTAMVGTVGTP